MNKEVRPKELYDTEARAHEFLRDATRIPSAPSLSDYQLRFRLWRYPAFEPCRSWSVFKSGGRRTPDAYLVRQVTWDQLHDFMRLGDPLLGLREGFHSHPKIEVRDRPLDSATLMTRIEPAHSISLPIFGHSSGICVDGTMLGFEERCGGPKLEWCCAGPPEWREFATWANAMMTWLQETCGD